MIKKIMKVLYNSGVFLLVSISFLLIITNLFWMFHLSLLKISLVLSFVGGAFILFKVLSGNKKEKFISLFIGLFVFALSIFASGYIYDQSDDGNTYHKETISMIKQGWNPIYDDYKDFAIANDFTYNHELWAEHYPKTSWIIGASIYDITGNVETGKCYNLLFMYITFVIISYTLIKIFNKLIFSFIFSLIAVINPVMISQVFSFYVDGFLGLLLFMIILYMFLFVDRIKDKKDFKIAKIILFSLIVIISNIKFTGLAYAGLFCLGYYVYYVIKELKNKNREVIIRNTLFFVFVVFVSVFIVGSSSYLKNTIDHGNPFYPLAGKDKVDIMTYLQPESFGNMSPIEKNFYSIFSKTANIGMFNNGEPVLKIPFTYDSYEIEQIGYDTRIGGYGVYFSGIFILSIISIFIFAFLLIKKDKKMFILYIIPLIITILLLLFLSDGWWARYAPYLYLFVLSSLIPFADYKNIALKIIFSMYALIILFNSMLCFKNFYYNDLPLSGFSKIEINKINNEKIKVYLVEDRFTGVLSNLRDNNIKYYVVDEKDDNMKPLYGNYAYYSIMKN